MSEPMSSVEIEDVLSSIRRLVSEDLRPLHRPTPHPAAFRPLIADRAMSQPADRLILTPALRVVRLAESPAKAVIAALAVAVEAQGDPWESETGDEAPVAQFAAAKPDTPGFGWAVDVWDEAVERALRARREDVPAPLILETIRTALTEELVVGSGADRSAEAAWNQDCDREVETPCAGRSRNRDRRRSGLGGAGRGRGSGQSRR